MARSKPKSAGRRARRASGGRQAAVEMVFGKRNYVLLLVSVGLIVLGYAIMAFDNARGLNERGEHLSLDSPLSLVVSPLVLLAGYVGIAVAILWREKKPDLEANDAST